MPLPLCATLCLTREGPVTVRPAGSDRFTDLRRLVAQLVGHARHGFRAAERLGLLGAAGGRGLGTLDVGARRLVVGPFTDSFVVSLPVDEAWKVFLDVERIAPCMPGAQLQEVDGDEYRGIV